jgi:hypothetical protein
VRRPRLRALLLSWAAIFVVAMLPNLLLPTRIWAALLRVAVGVCVAPALWTGQYFLFGPRAARRYLLIFRFVLFNWSRVDVIVARGERKATQ